MLDFAGLNWWAILAATVMAFAIGGLWYGPLFFKAWMKALGKTEDELQPAAAPFIISFCAALITSIVLAALINTLGITMLTGGLTIGLLTGVGFIAASMASDSAFCRSGVPLFLIQSGYRVTYSIAMGGVLAVWQ